MARLVLVSVLLVVMDRRASCASQRQRRDRRQTRRVCFIVVCNHVARSRDGAPDVQKIHLAHADMGILVSVDGRADGFDANY